MRFLLAIIMAAFIGGAAGYIGSLMLTKRMALTGGALGHLTLPGVALALIYGFDVSLGAFAMLTIGITLIWGFQIRSKLPMEAVTAVVFSSSVSIAFLFLPKDQTVPALIGNISQISVEVTAITAALSVGVFAIVKIVYPKMVLASISEDVASSEGIDVGKYNFIYLFGIGLIVALGVRVVGSLLTAALVAIPAATSMNFSKSHLNYSYGALILGGLSGILGVAIYRFTGTSLGPMEVASPGPFIIIVSAAFFIVSLLLKR